MNNHTITQKEERGILHQAILYALDELYRNDFYLIENGLHEQCIAFRFGIYLLRELQKTCFSDYDLDAEFNHSKADKKTLPSWPKGARPDLILHKRGSLSPSNILILELKKGKKAIVTKKDKQKIEEFKKAPYKYRHGATILISPSYRDVKCKDREINWI